MPWVAAAIPYIVAAAESVGTAVSGAAASLGISTASLVMGAASLAMGTISTLLTPTSSHGGPTRNPFGANPDEPRQWCYGRSATGGTMVYWETVGNSNKFLWLVIAVQDTLCDGFETFYANNVQVDFDGTGAATTSPIVITGCQVTGASDIVFTTSTAGLFAGMKIDAAEFGGGTRVFSVDSPTQVRMNNTANATNAAATIRFEQKIIYCHTDNSVPVMWRFDYLGEETQLADPNLVMASAGENGSGNWTSACRLQGMAYFVWKMQYGTSNYPTGLPTPLLILRGRRVYDPRQDTAYGGIGVQTRSDPTTWTWSQNAALCLLDYLLGVDMAGVRIGGCGIPIAAIDISSFIAAANICDQAVPLAAGGTEARYTINGFVDSVEDKSQVIQAMLTACDGMLTYRGGVIGLIVGAAQPTVMSLTDDDLAGQLNIFTSVSRQDKVNSITSSYAEPSQLYATVAAPSLIVPQYETDDGGLRLEHSLRHRFTSSLATVQRINKLTLANYREQFSIDAIYKPKALLISPGDTFNFSSSNAGYTGQKMLCMSRELNENGTVRIVARQETDAKYSWATSEEQSPPLFNTNALLDPTDVDAPNAGDINAQPATVVGADNTSVPAILLIASQPPNPFVVTIITQWQLATETDWHAGPSIVPAAPDGRTRITGLAPGVLYNVRFAYQTIYATSGWAEIDNISAGDTLSASNVGLISRYSNDEEPDWLHLGAGTGAGFVEHYTGILLPESSVLASALTKAQLWEQFVPSPVTSSIYEGVEIDLGANLTVVVTITPTFAAGRGVSGTPNVIGQIDNWLDGTSDPATWSNWTSGTITARFIRPRLVMTSGATPGFISGFSISVQAAPAAPQTGTATAGAGGTAITFSPAFSVTPNIQITPSGAAVAWKTGESKNGFTLHVGPDSSHDTGGTADWTASEAA